MEISKFSIEISIQKPPKASNLNGNLQMFNGDLHQKASNLNGNLQNFPLLECKSKCKEHE